MELKIILDAFNQSKGLDENIAKLERYVDLLDQIAKNKTILGGQTDLNSVAKTTTTIQSQTKAVNKLTDSMKEQAALKKQMLARDEDEVKGKIKLSNATAEQNRAIKTQIKLQEAEAGSYNELSAKLAILNKRYHEMSAAHREGSVTGKLLVAEQARIKAELQALDGKVGVHTRNVGNYAGAMLNAAKGVKGATGILSIFGSALGINAQYLQIATEASHGLLKAAKNMYNAAKLNTIATEANTTATTANTVATEAQTVAEEAEGVAKKANTGLIGLAIVAITALVYGIWSWVKATNAQEEAQRLLNQQLEDNLRYTKDYNEENEHNAKKNIETMEAQGKSEFEIHQQKLKNFQLIKDGAKQTQKDLEAISTPKEQTYQKEVNETDFWGKKKHARNKERLAELVDLEEQIEEQKRIQEDADKDAINEINKFANNSIDANNEKYEKLAEQTIDYSDKIRELRVALIKDDNIRTLEKMKLDAELQIEAVEKSVASEKQKNVMVMLIRDKLLADIDQFNDEQVKKQGELDKKLAEEKRKAEEILGKERLARHEAELKRMEENYKDEQRLRLAQANTKQETVLAQIVNEQENQKKALDELDKLFEHGLVTQAEYERKREILVREGNKRIDELNKSQKDATIDQIKQTVDAAIGHYIRQSEFKEKLLDDQLQKQGENVRRQEELADRGLSNTLAFEKKKQAELERAKIEEQRKQQKAKEIEAFFNAFAEYSKTDPQTAAAKALRDIVLAKVIAQRFAKGGVVEDELAKKAPGGIFNGPSHDQGGVLIEVEGKEGIFSKNEMANLGKGNFYSLKTLLKNPIDDEVFARQADGMTMLIPPPQANNTAILIEKIDELKDVVKNKKELDVNFPEMYRLLLQSQENGDKAVVEYIMKKPTIR